MRGDRPYVDKSFAVTTLASATVGTALRQLARRERIGRTGLAPALAATLFAAVAVLACAFAQVAQAKPVLERSLGLPSIAKPKDVALDSEGNLYVLNGHRVTKFSPDKEYLLHWGSHGSDPGQLADGASGLAIDADDNVYVADTGNHRIQVFDSEGNLKDVWGGNGQFFAPCGVDVGPDGTVYVADTNNHRVRAFDSEGNHLYTWGSRGDDPGQFRWPEDVAVGPDGKVYVADTQSHRVQVFDSEGNFQYQITGLFYPFGVEVTDQYVFVVNELGRLDLYHASDGTHYGTWREIYGKVTVRGEDVLVAAEDTGRIEWLRAAQQVDTLGPNYPGSVGPSYGMAVDDEGNVYVSDRDGHRIVKFDRDGEQVAAWGSRGSGDGEFNSPGESTSPPADGSTWSTRAITASRSSTQTASSSAPGAALATSRGSSGTRRTSLSAPTG